MLLTAMTATMRATRPAWTGAEYARDINTAAAGEPLAGLRIGLPRNTRARDDAAVARAIETALDEFRRSVQSPSR